MLEVTISDVSITNVGFAIFLKPTLPNYNKVVPIFIGPLETYSISSALDGVTPPRPNTHDLILSMVGELEVKVMHVVINDIIGNVFYARIVLQTRDGIVELDARPSDSVAIALRAHCPIFMNEKVYQEAAVVLGEESSSEKEEPEEEKAEEEKPRSELERMQIDLQKAVDEENFEKAAMLRDQIRAMTQEN